MQEIGKPLKDIRKQIEDPNKKLDDLWRKMADADKSSNGAGKNRDVVNDVEHEPKPRLLLPKPCSCLGQLRPKDPQPRVEEWTLRGEG